MHFARMSRPRYKRRNITQSCSIMLNRAATSPSAGVISQNGEGNFRSVPALARQWLHSTVTFFPRKIGGRIGYLDFGYTHVKKSVWRAFGRDWA